MDDAYSREAEDVMWHTCISKYVWRLTVLKLFLVVYEYLNKINNDIIQNV